MEIALYSVPRYRAFEESFCAEISRIRPDDRFYLTGTHGHPAAAMNCAVLLTVGRVTRDDLSHYPRLALIQTLSSGYEQIDCDAASAAGVWVSYAPSEQTSNADAVSEFIVMNILNLSRNLLKVVSAVTNAPPEPLPVAQGLAGKRACVVGLGGVGRALLKRLEPFGCDTVVVTRTPDKAGLDVVPRPLSDLSRVLSDADIVVLCLRADANNRHLFNDEIFCAMKTGAIFINVARASLVDEAALQNAIETGHLRAAALDVLGHEPVGAINTLVNFDETLITPHRAGLTDNMLHGTIQYVDKVLSAFLSGERPTSLLNEPAIPRRPLRRSHQEAVSLAAF